MSQPYYFFLFFRRTLITLKRIFFALALTFLLAGCGVEVPVVDPGFPEPGPTSPTPADTCASLSYPQLLADPDFELYDGSWTQNLGTRTVIDLATNNGWNPSGNTNGTSIAYLGGDINYIDEISQFFSVPAGSTGGLDFYGDFSVSSVDDLSIVYDELFIDLYANGTFSETIGYASNTDQSANWAPFNTSTTTDYSSSNVEMVIWSGNDSSSISHFLLDNLGLYCM